MPTCQFFVSFETYINYQSQLKICGNKSYLGNWKVEEGITMSRFIPPNILSNLTTPNSLKSNANSDDSLSNLTPYAQTSYNFTREKKLIDSQFPMTYMTIFDARDCNPDLLPLSTIISEKSKEVWGSKSIVIDEDTDIVEFKCTMETSDGLHHWENVEHQYHLNRRIYFPKQTRTNESQQFLIFFTWQNPLTLIYEAGTAVTRHTLGEESMLLSKKKPLKKKNRQIADLLTSLDMDLSESLFANLFLNEGIFKIKPSTPHFLNKFPILKDKATTLIEFNKQIVLCILYLFLHLIKWFLLGIRNILEKFI